MSELGLGEIELKIGNLRLTPDDILVIKLKTECSYKELARISKTAEHMAGKFGANVMVLPHDVDVSVIRKRDIDPEALRDAETVVCLSGPGEG